MITLLYDVVVARVTVKYPGVPLTAEMSSHNQQSAAKLALENPLVDAPLVVATMSEEQMSVPALPIVDLSSILNVTLVLLVQ